MAVSPITATCCATVALRNGCPSPEDDHPLHGEMPCAPMDRAGLGDDLFAQDQRENFERHGIDTRHVGTVPVTPVDTTGAGDAFIGSFAMFYAEDRNLRAALTRAARYAAHAITSRGTQKSYATLAEFERFEASL